MNTKDQHQQIKPKFTSMRLKFIISVSLIIIVACTTVSWFIMNKTSREMIENLITRYRLIANNLAYNSRYGVFTEDKAALNELMKGILDIDDVVYVSISNQEGVILVEESNGGNKNLYPNWIREEARKASEPLVILFRTEDGDQLYDISAPIFAKKSEDVEFLPDILKSQTRDPIIRRGFVQIGITLRRTHQKMNEILLVNILIIFTIILTGIAVTIFFARLWVKPLQNLTDVALKVADGDLSQKVNVVTKDEVGRLSTVFNRMVESLLQRNQEIQRNLTTITKQASEMSALYQISAAITSTLELDKLLETVLNLIVESLGFDRAMFMLLDEKRMILGHGRIACGSVETRQFFEALEIPISKNLSDNTAAGYVVLTGQPLLIEDVDHSPVPLNSKVVHTLHTNSFIMVPLKVQKGIIGILSIDNVRTNRVLTGDDQRLIMTLATPVAIAIDNAIAYKQLEDLTITLEEKVRIRTMELQAANEKLQELDQLKSNFVSNVSHELRTPLASIKGYIDNMLEGITGMLTEQQAAYLGRVKSNTNRLNRLINDLLDISKIESGNVHLCPVELSPSEVATEVVAHLKPLVFKKNLAIDISACDPNIRIFADHDKLNQIIMNLLDNAIKFTPAGGHISVEIGFQDENWVLVSITDDGEGIHPEDLPRIFDPFYQVENQRGTRVKGSGLGLTITKSLVELHGGKIWVESAIGMGSRFFFSLPIRHQS